MRLNFSFLWKFLVGFVIIILFFISIFAAFRDKKNGPSQTGGKKIIENSIKVSAISGTLEVNNFTDNVVRETADSLVLAETKDYIINYFKKDKAFVVLLLSEPLRNSREEAGKMLKKRLGIPEAQICRLNLSVVVPYDVSSKFSGRNLGLGFCLSSEEL